MVIDSKNISLKNKKYFFDLLYLIDANDQIPHQKILDKFRASPKRINTALNWLYSQNLIFVIEGSSGRQVSAAPNAVATLKWLLQNNKKITNKIEKRNTPKTQAAAVKNYFPGTRRFKSLVDRLKASKSLLGADIPIIRQAVPGGGRDSKEIDVFFVHLIALACDSNDKELLHSMWHEEAERKEKGKKNAVSRTDGIVRGEKSKVDLSEGTKQLSKKKKRPVRTVSSITMNYQKAVTKIKSSKPITNMDVLAISGFAQSIGGAGAIPDVLHLFNDLIASTKSDHNKRTLRNMKQQTVWNLERLEQGKIADAQMASPSLRKNEHIQKTIFDRVRLHPEEFYKETQDASRGRANNIQNAIDNLDSSVRMYAEFNLQFFLALASEERTFEPIKLPDTADYFRWPDTDVINRYRNAQSLDIDAEDAGILSMLGYNAQLDGPTDPERRRTLDDLFNGNIRIPNSLPEEYVVQWGAAKSVIRLRKIAFSIATFTRQQKRKRNASLQAIGKWEADLAYLRGRYYEPFSSHFNWPAT